MANEKVYFGYTLKEVRQQQIGLGLDLKGGMNVILKLNAADLVKNLAGNPEDPNFAKALDAASKSPSQSNYIDQFVTEYKRLSPGANLAVLFGSGDLRDQINPSTSEAKVIELLKEKYNSAVEASFNVLRVRIDRFGVVAPNLQRLEGQGRILVELPGVKEPERVRELLQRSANLQFWRTYSIEEVGNDLMGLSDRLLALGAPAPAAAPADSLAADSTSQRVAAAPAAAVPAHIDTLAKYLQIGGRGGATVAIANDRDRSKIDSLLALATEHKLLPEDLKLMWGAKAIEDPKTGKATSLYELYAIRTNRSGKPDLSGDVVVSAKGDVDHQQIGSAQPHVSMTMNQEGAQIWARLTKENKYRCIAIVLDGVVYSAPSIRDEITGGQSSISGNFTIEEATDLANVLNSGKMETTIVIEQENVVGPTLGRASIEAGIISFAIALVLLMIYMCLAYGFIPGMIANLALVVNSFFTLGILASFNAVLTLSGIAGLVLTLGMAVDANVLIYERTKEELRAGKNIKQALADGYGNAFSAIFDSNLTSIITAIILYNFGTGPIRGFALTLAIGIVASFFTAVWLTRIAYEHFLDKDKWLGLTFTTGLSKKFLTNTNFGFMKMASKTNILVGILVIGGAVSLATRGLQQGIDFTGGRNFVVEFEQKANPEQVKKAVEDEIAKTGQTGTVGVLSIVTTQNPALRISTSYKIDQNDEKVDQEVEQLIWRALHNNKLVNADYATFKDRDNRKGGSIISAQKVGPSVAADLTRGAIISVILSLIAIFIYILFRFRSVAFSVGAIVALAIDTFIIIGIYSACWGFLPFSLEVDQTFIGAILTVIGYSINDKVVVFDRIRENIGLYPTREPERLFNDSINNTLTRTIMTSLTTLLVLLCIFFLGGDAIRSFSFAMILGVIVGTLSSIFMAAPIAYKIYGNRQAKKAAKA